MNYYRFRFGEEASQKLESLKHKTAITPNLLARIGFALSLTDPTVPDPRDYEPDSDREIDRHTLTGQWDSLVTVMLIERCCRDGIGQDGWMDQFKAHMNRGVLLLDMRVNN